MNTPTFPPQPIVKTFLRYFKIFSNFLHFHSGFLRIFHSCMKADGWKPTYSSTPGDCISCVNWRRAPLIAKLMKTLIDNHNHYLQLLALFIRALYGT